MPIKRLISAVPLVAFSALFLFCQERSEAPHRDPTLLDVLSRVVQAAGGEDGLAKIHDLTESGQIVFNWSGAARGPVVVRVRKGTKFRMDADLPDGKHSWVVKGRVGIKAEPHHKAVPMTSEGAIDLCNLTFPLANVVAALADPTTEVSLVKIESQSGRPVYRLRTQNGGAPAHGHSSAKPNTKELLIDATTFDILSAGDSSLTFHQADQLTTTPEQVVQYSDFRFIDGIRVPFNISMSLMGQQTLQIQLQSAEFNTNLTDADFAIESGNNIN